MAARYGKESRAKVADSHFDPINLFLGSHSDDFDNGKLQSRRDGMNGLISKAAFLERTGFVLGQMAGHQDGLGAWGECYLRESS
jgi:hypothetical protein